MARTTNIYSVAKYSVERESSIILIFSFLEYKLKSNCREMNINKIYL